MFAQPPARHASAVHATPSSQSASRTHTGHSAGSATQGSGSITTQPFDSPPDGAGVADIIDMIGSDKMFLFSSDYPHWQFDGDDAIPPHLPASLVQRMCADNPLETFPRLKLAA